MSGPEKTETFPVIYVPRPIQPANTNIQHEIEDTATSKDEQGNLFLSCAKV